MQPLKYTLNPTHISFIRANLCHKGFPLAEESQTSPYDNRIMHMYDAFKSSVKPYKPFIDLKTADRYICSELFKAHMKRTIYIPVPLNPANWESGNLFKSPNDYSYVITHYGNTSRNPDRCCSRGCYCTYDIHIFRVPYAMEVQAHPWTQMYKVSTVNNFVQKFTRIICFLCT